MASKARGGFVVIHRSIYENPVFRSPAEALAFAYLFSKAAWGPTKVKYRRRETVLERGQLTISVRDFAEAMERSRMWAKRFLERLEEAGMIEKKWDSRGTVGEPVGGTVTNVISICNYDKYQGVTEEVGTVDGTPVGTLTGTENKEEKEAPSKDNNKLLSKGSPNRRHEWGGGEPPVEWVQWAMENMAWSRGSSVREANLFIDNAKAHRRLYVDWFAAWRNWCRSPFQKTTSQQQALTL